MSREWIPGNLRGILRTLEIMGELAREGASAPIVRETAELVMGGAVYPGDALRSWLARRWIVVPDPFNVELVSSPALQLERWARRPELGLRGDCDDLATLAAALALACGLGARYRAIVTGMGPLPDHVFTELEEPGGTWIELDIMRPADGATTHTEEVTLYL